MLAEAQRAETALREQLARETSERQALEARFTAREANCRATCKTVTPNCSACVAAWPRASVSTPCWPACRARRLGSNTDGTRRRNHIGARLFPGVLVRGKPTLVAAVRHVDQLMLRIQGTGKVSSNERIAVMAALQIAGELLAESADGPLGGLAVGDFKRRIEDMNATLDDALSGQEKLL